MITVNLVPPVRYIQKEKKSTVLVQKEPQVYFLTMKIYPIQQERHISFCQTFLWQSFSAWLACVFAPNSSANKVVKEATTLRRALVRRCQIIITDICLFLLLSL